MSRKGNCWDNAPMESFFGHMKDELHLENCLTYELLEKEINEVWNGISQRIYASNAQPNSQQTTSSGTTEQAADAEPQDAEFEEVK